MGNYGDDRHGGGDRWQGRGQGYDRDYRGRGGDGERGFIDRAGDEVRSWFGDDDAQRRREADQRRWEQEQRMSGRRDNDSGPGTFGGGGFGTGWGNQAGNSWNRERPGERGGYGDGRGGYGDGERRYARGEREGWFTDSEGGERGRRFGGSGGGHDPSGLHDPHYSEWRRRQIEDLDRDYEEYRREHQSKFETEFGSWRSKRQGQRQSLGRVTEHMEVIGSDGSHVGTVDKVRGDRIILTKSDSGAGGMHHSVPCSWVESVDKKVTLNKSADEATAEWRNEERSRALFERDREDGGEGGPRNLDRAFSGTYEGREGKRDE